MQQGSWLGHIYLLELLTTPNSVAVFVLLGYSPPFPVPKAWAVAANFYGRHNSCPGQHKGEERITFKELSSRPPSYSCYSPSHLPSYMYTNSRELSFSPGVSHMWFVYLLWFFLVLEPTFASWFYIFSRVEFSEKVLAFCAALHLGRSFNLHTL